VIGHLVDRHKQVEKNPTYVSRSRKDNDID